MSTLSREVPKLPAKQPQPETVASGQVACPMGMPRRVAVKATQGVDVTVVVKVVQGTVWLSISPPFTWEAIMEPGKVDELLRVLELARDEAKTMAAARREQPPRASKAVVRAIPRSTAT